MAWDGERTVTFTMEDALISPVGLSILSGAGLIDASTSKPVITHVTEVCQVVEKDSNGVPVIALQKKPHVVTNNPSIYVMGLNDNGDVATEPFLYTYDGEIYDATTGTTLYKIALLTNAWGGQTYNSTPNEPNNVLSIKNCTTVLVDYYTSYRSNAFAINITPDKFGGTFYLEASTLWRDQATGKDLPAEFIIPSCKVQSNFSFSLSSSGDPSTFTFTMDAFPDYTRWDRTEKVLATIQVLGTDLNNEEQLREGTWTDYDPENTVNQVKQVGSLTLQSWRRTFTVPNVAGRNADPDWATKIMNIELYLTPSEEITNFVIHRKQCLDTESAFTAYRELMLTTDYTVSDSGTAKKFLFNALDPHYHYIFLIEGYTNDSLTEGCKAVVVETRAPLAMGTVEENQKDGLEDTRYAAVLSGTNKNLATSLKINFQPTYTLTSDEEVDSDKEYYTRNEDVYTLVAEPSSANLSTYYEKDQVSEANVVSFSVVLRFLSDAVIKQGAEYPAWSGTEGAYNLATISIRKSESPDYKLLESYNYAKLLDEVSYGTNAAAGKGLITKTFNATTALGDSTVGTLTDLTGIYIAVYNDLYKFTYNFSSSDITKAINNAITTNNFSQVFISPTFTITKR